MIGDEIECRGSSMRPLLKWGDRVRYVRADPSELSLGDLVVFLFANVHEPAPSLSIHRLVWKTSSGGVWRLWTKGDSRPDLDPEMPAGALIGKVVAIKRNAGPWRSASNARGRLGHLAIGAASNAAFGVLFALHGAIAELSARMSRRPTPGLRGARRAVLELMLFLETLLPVDWGFRVLIATPAPEGPRE